MRKFIFTIVVGLALVLTGMAVHAVTVHEATGKGAFLDNDGNSVSLQFKAGIDDLGNIFGEVQQVTHLPDKDFKFHGTVLCFDPVNENTAVFVGVIDSSSDPPSRTNFFVVEVVDDTPDQITIASDETFLNRICDQKSYYRNDVVIQSKNEV